MSASSLSNVYWDSISEISANGTKSPECPHFYFSARGFAEHSVAIRLVVIVIDELAKYSRQSGFSATRRIPRYRGATTGRPVSG